jgi:GMP synthase-like glutamine amidotransferase
MFERKHMSILIIKNAPHEGPGTIEDYLKKKSLPYSTEELYRREEIPDLTVFSHLVIMGGPMAVYEMDGYPHLIGEDQVIKEFIQAGKSVLGICLGAQMIAHALGARVYPGSVAEVGWYSVHITPEGMDDPLFSKLAVNHSPRADVFHWHGDTFDLPADAVRIAYSESYENQAFRYGHKVYALQFHIEVTPDIIWAWFKDKKDCDMQDMMNRTENVYEDYSRRAFEFYEDFFL